MVVEFGKHIYVSRQYLSRTSVTVPMYSLTTNTKELQENLGISSVVLIFIV
jgi:hypothetical protein